jgi:hypothetical protein
LFWFCGVKFKVKAPNKIEQSVKTSILRLLKQQLSRLLLAKFSNSNLKNRNLKVRYLALALNLKEAACKTGI